MYVSLVASVSFYIKVFYIDNEIYALKTNLTK